MGLAARKARVTTKKIMHAFNRQAPMGTYRALQTMRDRAIQQKLISASQLEASRDLKLIAAAYEEMSHQYSGLGTLREDTGRIRKLFVNELAKYEQQWHSICLAKYEPQWLSTRLAKSEQQWFSPRLAKDEQQWLSTRHCKELPSRHCEELPSRHCEERSDEAIHLFNYYNPSLSRQVLRIVGYTMVALVFTAFAFVVLAIVLTTIGSPLSTMVVAGLSMQGLVTWISQIPMLTLLTTASIPLLISILIVSSMSSVVAWYGALFPDHITRLWRSPAYLQAKNQFKVALYTEADVGSGITKVVIKTLLNPVRWLSYGTRLLHGVISRAFATAAPKVFINVAFSLVLIPLDILSTVVDLVMYHGIMRSFWLIGGLGSRAISNSKEITLVQAQNTVVSTAMEILKVNESLEQLTCLDHLLSLQQDAHPVDAVLLTQQDLDNIQSLTEKIKVLKASVAIKLWHRSKEFTHSRHSLKPSAANLKELTVSFPEKFSSQIQVLQAIKLYYNLADGKMPTDQQYVDMLALWDIPQKTALPLSLSARQNSFQIIFENLDRDLNDTSNSVPTAILSHYRNEIESLKKKRSNRLLIEEAKKTVVASFPGRKPLIDIEENELFNLVKVCQFYHGLGGNTQPTDYHYIELLGLFNMSKAKEFMAPLDNRRNLCFKYILNALNEELFDDQPRLEQYQVLVHKKLHATVVQHLANQFFPTTNIEYYANLLKRSYDTNQSVWNRVVQLEDGKIYDTKTDSKYIVFLSWILLNPEKDLPDQLTPRQLHELKKLDLTAMNLQLAYAEKTRIVTAELLNKAVQDVQDSDLVYVYNQLNTDVMASDTITIDTTFYKKLLTKTSTVMSLDEFKSADVMALELKTEVISQFKAISMLNQTLVELFNNKYKLDDIYESVCVPVFRQDPLCPWFNNTAIQKQQHTLIMQQLMNTTDTMKVHNHGTVNAEAIKKAMLEVCWRTLAFQIYQLVMTNNKTGKLNQFELLKHNHLNINQLITIFKSYYETVLKSHFQPLTSVASSHWSRLERSSDTKEQLQLVSQLLTQAILHASLHWCGKSDDLLTMLSLVQNSDQKLKSQLLPGQLYVLEHNCFQDGDNDCQNFEPKVIIHSYHSFSGYGLGSDDVTHLTDRCYGFDPDIDSIYVNNH